MYVYNVCLSLSYVGSCEDLFCDQTNLFQSQTNTKKSNEVSIVHVAIIKSTL